MPQYLGVLEYRHSNFGVTQTCFDEFKRVIYKSKAKFYPYNGYTVYHLITGEFIIVNDNDIIREESYTYGRV